MKNGVPVMTTDVGAEGISHDCLLADNTFASLLDYYNSEQKLLDVSKTEIEFIKNHYSYEAALASLKEDLKSLK